MLTRCLAQEGKANNDPSRYTAVASDHPLEGVKRESAARWRKLSSRDTRKRICCDEVVRATKKKPAARDNRANMTEGELNSGATDAKAVVQCSQGSSSSGVEMMDELKVPPGPSSTGIHHAGPSGNGRAASTLFQEAMLIDDSGSRRVQRRLRPTSPGPTPGPSSGPHSISSSGGSASSGGSGSSGMGKAGHRTKARLRLTGMPPWEERQAALQDMSVANVMDTAKEVTDAAKLTGPVTRSRWAKLSLAAQNIPTATASTACRARPLTRAASVGNMPVTTPIVPCRRRSVEHVPMAGEAAPQQQKQVVHASRGPAPGISRVSKTAGGQQVVEALRQVWKVDLAKSSGAAQTRAASTPAAPTATQRGSTTATPLQHPSVASQRPPSHKTVATEPFFQAALRSQSSRQLPWQHPAFVHGAQHQPPAAEPGLDKAHNPAELRRSAVAFGTQFQTPSAQAHSRCLQDALQQSPSRRSGRASHLKRARTEQLGNMDPVSLASATSSCPTAVAAESGSCSSIPEPSQRSSKRLRPAVTTDVCAQQ